MLDADLRSKLAKWAASKPTIKGLYVFGSYAKGEARADSDLDLAFEFVDGLDDPLAELIENAAAWKAELTALAGITVKDLYLHSDEVVGSERVTVFSQ